MRKLLIAMIFIASVQSLKAQYYGYTALSNLENFKTQFSLAAQKTITIKSDFVQEKNLSLLTEKIESRGKFWFKKENKVRMEYNQPFQYLMVINNNKLYIKDGQKENVISTKSNKIFQQINRITLDCVQGTVMGNPDFKTKVFESKTNYMIELVPVTKGIKDFFKSIKVIIDKRAYSVSSIDMVELSGDNTMIKFINKEINANISEALFAIK